MILDTYPLVDFFKGAVEIELLLKKMEKKEIKLAISSLTLTELYYIFARFKDEDFAKTVLNYLKTSELSILPITVEIAEKAGEFKFRYSSAKPRGIPIADCIIAATAFFQKTTLVTTDEHFKKIKEITVKTPEEI